MLVQFFSYADFRLRSADDWTSVLVVQERMLDGGCKHRHISLTGQWVNWILIGKYMKTFRLYAFRGCHPESCVAQ